MSKLVCNNDDKHTEYLSSIVDQSIFCANQFAGPKYVGPSMKFCPYCGYVLNHEEEGVYKKFLVQDDYVKSFTNRGEVVPPFLVFQEYVIRNEIEGYLVLCRPDDPDAELQPVDSKNND